jgi:TonB family protein
MKKIIFSAVVLFIANTSFAQDGYLSDMMAFRPASSDNFGYSVRIRYDRPVYIETLNKSTLISDAIEGYPVNWISEYQSVTISTTNNGKKVVAVSPNERLTLGQKNILKAADMGSEITVNVKYKYVDPLTKNSNDQEIYVAMQVINFKMTVTPEKEAEYVGGDNEMRAYLKEKAITKIPDATIKTIKTAQVTFTVNEVGEIENAKISKTTKDAGTDKLLVDAINNMPKWKPAQNAAGKKVKQEFVFNIGEYGC